MLFTVANAEWSPGSPLAPSQAPAGLFRLRESAGEVAGGRPTLAVALRYDPARGVVVAAPPASRESDNGWTAPAILNDAGALTVFSPIPASLVRVVGRPSIRLHVGHPDHAPRSRSGLLAGAGSGRGMTSALGGSAVASSPPSRRGRY